MEKLKILLADDEADFRKPLAGLIRTWGYDLIEVENGKEALEFAKSEKPDIIILDCMMPEMDGLTALEQIRKIMPDVPAIMLTSYTNNQIIKAAAKLEINAFVPKLSTDSDAHTYVKKAIEMMARKLKAR